MRQAPRRNQTKKIVMQLEVSTTTIIIGIGATVGSVMLTIIGFFLVRLVKSIDLMAKELSSVKLTLVKILEKHDYLEKQVEENKEEIKELKLRFA